MFKWLNLLLLLQLCCVRKSESPLDETPIEGEKGGNVTLPCKYKASEISDIRFIRWGKSKHFAKIPFCQNEEKESESESDKVCKKGACEVVLKHLNSNDSGTYMLRFMHKDTQTELKYKLDIHEIKTGSRSDDELKSDTEHHKHWIGPAGLPVFVWMVLALILC
ncbi:hypothetical protein cypCar_00043858 [Cyprinus carpio]|nr:hypothetical protein cypCar_00043858 [Cyprinus carpio]